MTGDKEAKSMYAGSLQVINCPYGITRLAVGQEELMLRQTAQIPIAALYARLSRDDELQGESNSIMNHANAVQGEDLRIERK